MISLYESIGAAIATVLSQLVVDLLQYNHIKNEIKIKELFNVCWKYLISALLMFVFCFGTKIILNTSIISNSIQNLSTNKQIVNIISISSQIIVGVITYFIMLIILKDDYIFKFIDRIKSHILKKKVS